MPTRLSYLPRVRVGRTTCKPGLNIMLLWIHWVTMQLTNELYVIPCFTGCCLYEDCDKNPCDQLGNKDAVCSKMASCQSDKCNFDYKTAKASQRPTLPSRASRKFFTASVITLILTALAFLHQCLTAKYNTAGPMCVMFLPKEVCGVCIDHRKYNWPLNREKLCVVLL